MKALASSIFLSLFAASCGVDTFEYAPLNPPPHAMFPRSPASVEVYFATPPSRPHVQVGLLSAEISHATVAEMVDRLRWEAAQRGCDALVIGDPSHGEAPDPGLAALNLVGTVGAVASKQPVEVGDDDVPVTELSGACIDYADSAGATSPPPPPPQTAAPEPSSQSLTPIGAH